VPPIVRAATGPHEDELDGSRSARKLWALGVIFAQLVVTNALFVAVVLSTLPALVPHQQLIDAFAPTVSAVGGWRVGAALAVGDGAAAVELAGGVRFSRCLLPANSGDVGDACHSSSCALIDSMTCKLRQAKGKRPGKERRTCGRQRKWRYARQTHDASKASHTLYHTAVATVVCAVKAPVHGRTWIPSTLEKTAESGPSCLKLHSFAYAGQYIQSVSD